MGKTRNHSYDIIAGLLMIHVVFLHVSTMVFGEDTNTLWMIYPKLTFFAMPWFFYKSGTFYRGTGEGKMIIHKLLIPYLLFIIVSFIEWCVFSRHVFFQESLNKFIMTGEIPGNFALYFMATFILVKTFTSFVDIRRIALPLMLGCFIAAFALNRLDLNIPIYCENTFLGLFYFCLGYLFVKTKEIELLVKGRTIKGNYIWLLIAAVVMISYFFIPSWVEFPGNLVVYGNYIMGFIGAGAAIIIINQLFSYMRSNIVLEWIGRNSLVILGTHLNILLLGKMVAIKLTSNQNMQCLIMLSLVVLVMPVVVKVLTHPKLSFLGLSHD